MRAELKDASVDVIRKVMEINFFGAVYCTHFALNSILERKGIIVGVSSIAGYRGLPGRSGYSASKFALQGWLEAIRTELIESGVHVMWVCPGFTASNIRNAALNNIDSWGLQLGTYASHERFNDQTLFLHPKEIRPLFELRGCGHLGKNSIE